MRVLFATHAPRDPLTAVYSYYSRRAEWLEAAGHEVEVVVPGDLPRSSAVRSRWWPVVYARELQHRLEGSSPLPDLAIFHSYAGWATALRRSRAQRLGALRVVTQFHGLEPLYFRAVREEMKRAGAPLRLRTRLLAGALVPALARVACRRSDHVLCLNRRELAYLVEKRWVRAGDASILPSQVPEEFFVHHRARERCTNLLFVGQWQEGKGIRYLAAALDRLVERHSDLHLTCVGTRATEDVVKRSFSELARERVRVVPDIERGALVDELRSADLFVFPTLSEGFSLALLEAMAAGLPVVCTPVGSAPDLLEDGVSASFVAPAVAGSIVSAVDALLDRMQDRQRLGDAAAAKAREYTVDLWRPRFVALMEHLGRRSRD